MTIISTSDMDFKSLMYGSCSWRWSWTYFWRWWATASSLTNTSDAAGPPPVGGGGQHGGFDALDYRKIRQGNAGKLGTYDILSILPDKFARFLFEFHAHRFESLDLPFLPADRSDFDVHGALLDDKVHEYVMLCALICHSLKCSKVLLVP